MLHRDRPVRTSDTNDGLGASEPVGEAVRGTGRNFFASCWPLGFALAEGWTILKGHGNDLPARLS